MRDCQAGRELGTQFTSRRPAVCSEPAAWETVVGETKGWAWCNEHVTQSRLLHKLEWVTLI